MQQCAIIITQYKKYYICKFKLLKNDKFCNNPLKPHCSAPCIEPHHQFIPLWGAEGITDATGATCSPHYTNQNVLCLCTYKDSPISVAKILAGTDFCLCIEYLHLPSQALDPIGKVAVSVWEHFST